MSATPVVYFIDDSATMREVIKIAFRRENINVLACHDAATAIAMMEQNAPDVVISDVIMPDKDGYEVCEHIKQHPRFGRTPVILMSGVVNRQVAEKAFAVKADELIRKPFQPQDLITRVRHLLDPNSVQVANPATSAAAATASAAALSSIFASPVPRPMQAAARPMAAPMEQRPIPQMPAVSASRPAPSSIAATVAAVAGPNPAAAPQVAIPTSQVTAPPMTPQSRVPAPPTSSTMDAGKMRLELLRMQSQIKKLESELQAEREYSRALEEHIKTLQENE